jgi:RimJ/RimL family protein N-acetyltransferase
VVRPHDPTTTVESEGDHWRYRVTCDGTGCDGVAIYTGTSPSEHEALAAAAAAEGMHKPILTERLVIRAPIDPDRAELLQLFADEGFMRGLTGPFSEETATHRLAGMVDLCKTLAYAEQPIVELGTSRIIGYAGAARWSYLGVPRLEFNCRLILNARKHGYAREAGEALLDVWDETDRGEIFARINRSNTDAKNLALELRFGPESRWTEDLGDQEYREIYPRIATSR